VDISVSCRQQHLAARLQLRSPPPPFPLALTIPHPPTRGWIIINKRKDLRSTRDRQDHRVLSWIGGSRTHLANPTIMGRRVVSFLCSLSLSLSRMAQVCDINTHGAAQRNGRRWHFGTSSFKSLAWLALSSRGIRTRKGTRGWGGPVEVPGQTRETRKGANGGERRVPTIHFHGSPVVTHLISIAPHLNPHSA
jgi:hypothetical protein